MSVISAQPAPAPLTEAQLEALAIELSEKKSVFSNPADYIYEKLADLKAEQGNHQSAVDTAEKINDLVIQNRVLYSIFKKSKDFSMQKKIAEKLSSWSPEQERDKAFLALLQAAPDLVEAQKAADEINQSTKEAGQSLLERILKLIDELLGKKDVAGALKLFSSAHSLVDKERLLSHIFEKVEDKEHLKLIEEALSSLTYQKQEEILQKLKEKYTALNDPEGVSRVADRIQQIESNKEILKEQLGAGPLITPFCALLLAGACLPALSIFLIASELISPLAVSVLQQVGTAGVLIGMLSATGQHYRNLRAQRILSTL